MVIKEAHHRVSAATLSYVAGFNFAFPLHLQENHRKIYEM
jgi:hypothetical protein